MSTKTFVTIHELSRRLGLSAVFLKAEANAKRIPFIRAGRRLMFDANAVEHILIKRARASEGVSDAE